MVDTTITQLDPTGAHMDTDAFKKLYPKQFFERFFKEGVRPDGRTLGRARPVSIGLGAISSSQGSCLVKLGSTVVLAGVRAQTGECPEGKPNCGVFKINVEMAPFATADTRSSSAQEMLSTVSQRLQHALQPLNIEQQLVINEGKAAFHVQLDVYVLNADGAVLDAALLACNAALLDTQLPPIKDKSKQQGSEAAAAPAAGVPRQLQLNYLPLAVTCALFSEHVLVDPTGEEETVAHSAVSVMLDAQGMLHGVHQLGGDVHATPMTYMRCIEAAKLRYKEVAALLQQQLQERAAAKLAVEAGVQGPAPMHM